MASVKRRLLQKVFDLIYRHIPQPEPGEGPEERTDEVNMNRGGIEYGDNEKVQI